LSKRKLILIKLRRNFNTKKKWERMQKKRFEILLTYTRSLVTWSLGLKVFRFFCSFSSTNWKNCLSIYWKHNRRRSPWLTRYSLQSSCCKV
jgi:hypothetical protein